MKKVLFILTVVQNTLIGKSKQSIGNATFSTWKGINVLKSKPVTVENPNTINQQMRRAALAEMVGIFRQTSNVVSIGWKELAVGKSEYNAFVGYNLKNAFDYSAPPAATLQEPDLKFTGGTIITQPITTASASQAGVNITVNWNSAVLQPGQSATDKAVLVAYNASAGTIFGYVSNVLRSANTMVVTSPYAITNLDDMHIYLGFVKPDYSKAADSSYIAVTAGA